MTLQEAQALTLRVLKQVMEEKLDHHNVQLALVCITATNSYSANQSVQVTPNGGFEILNEVKLKEAIEAM